MKEVRSESGMLNIRVGKVGGKETIVSHRDPTNGKLWCEDIRDGDFNGKWIDSDKVEFE